MTKFRAFSCCAFLLALGSSLAQAQTAPAPAVAPVPAVAPPPTAAPEPASAPAAAPDSLPAPAPESSAVLAAPPAAAACFPTCRSGYVCGAGGQCISACNPLCGAGESCSAQGECVAPKPAAVSASSASPEPPVPAEQQRGTHTHDGFMLRVALGIGGGSMQADYNSVSTDNASYTGGGVALSLDIGGGLTDNLTLHGRIAALSIGNPVLSMDGAEYTLEDTTLSSLLIGPGLTYTFMPINMYLTGVVGLAGNTLSYDDHDRDTDDTESGTIKPGFGLNIDVGKEWWVARQVGIGAALRFWFATSKLDDVGYPADRRMAALALLFSVTYQ